MLQILQSKPGATGIVDVYSITSAVNILRVDGKLHFDSGYVSVATDSGQRSRKLHKWD